MQTGIYLFWILFIVIALYSFVLPIRRGGAVWVPTYHRVVRRMLELARVKKGEVVYDLGSGDGRIPIAAARKFGAQAVGAEINFLLVWWARLRSRLMGVRNVRFIWKDLWSIDVSKADVITLFLYDWSTIKLGEKLLREAKPDVRVVSHLWKLGKGWKLVDHDEENRVLVYQKDLIKSKSDK